jgi:hypothetical protein
MVLLPNPRITIKKYPENPALIKLGQLSRPPVKIKIHQQVRKSVTITKTTKEPLINLDSLFPIPYSLFLLPSSFFLLPSSFFLLPSSFINKVLGI